MSKRPKQWNSMKLFLYSFSVHNMELLVIKIEIDIPKIYKSKRNNFCYKIGIELMGNLIKKKNQFDFYKGQSEIPINSLKNRSLTCMRVDLYARIYGNLHNKVIVLILVYCTSNINVCWVLISARFFLS